MRGLFKPLFYLNMINPDKIKSLFYEWQKDELVFLVDNTVKPGNKITVLIDRIGGLSISDCVDLSRFIEGNLDREKDDFELSVSSPGAEAPFKVAQQYQKNIGRTIKITTNNDVVHTGVLVSLVNDTVEIEPEKPKKSKIKVEPISQFLLKDIKETRVIISFK